MASKAEVLDGGSRKRAHGDSASGVEVKRQRMGPTQPTFQILPLGAGPYSLADVFALTQNAGLRTFDVSQVPASLAAKISVNTIARIDTSVLDRAIEVSWASFLSSGTFLLTIMAKGGTRSTCTPSRSRAASPQSRDNSSWRRGRWRLRAIRAGLRSRREWWADTQQTRFRTFVPEPRAATTRGVKLVGLAHLQITPAATFEPKPGHQSWTWNCSSRF